MTDGALIDETEDSSLRHDFACILLEYSRDRPPSPPGKEWMPEQEAHRLAEHLETVLRLRSGGRYLQKRNEAIRRRRNAAIVAAFNGKNHAELIRKFNVSPRLLQYILAEARRRKVAQQL